jgi:hypothetical protein
MTVSISIESFTSKARAEKRAREIKRRGDYQVRVFWDVDAWVVHYWEVK